LAAIPDISDLPVGDGVANLSVRQGAVCPCPAAADRDGGLKGTAAAVPQLLHPDHPAVLPRAGQRLNGGLHRLRRHRDHCQGVTAGGIGILCLSGGAPLLRQRDMGGAAQTVAEHQDQNHHHQDNKARGD
ncbi:Metallopeptidase family protein, partial [Dysosmobacter welbionis]